MVVGKKNAEKGNNWIQKAFRVYCIHFHTGLLNENGKKKLIQAFNDIPRSKMKIFQALKFQFHFHFESFSINNDQNLSLKSNIAVTFDQLAYHPGLCQVPSDS